MADLIFLGVVVGFFVLCVTYVRGVDRMIRAADAAEVSAGDVDESAR